MAIVLLNGFPLSFLREHKGAKILALEVTPEELRTWLKLKAAEGIPIVSAIGHDATAKLMSEELEIRVKKNRIFVDANPRDIYVVFQLLERTPEGVVYDYATLRKIPHTYYLVKVVPIKEKRKAKHV